MIVAETYTRDGQTGRLRNIRHEASIPPGHVELVAMPAGTGPWVYDAPNKRAVSATLSDGEKIDRAMPQVPARVIAALVVGALPAADTTAAEKTWARAVLLDARDRMRAARDA